MRTRRSNPSDPWHIDILFATMQQTLSSLVNKYHQKPCPEQLYRTLTLLYDMLDALVVQIPDPNPLLLRSRNRHSHFRTKQVQNHIVEAKRE